MPALLPALGDLGLVGPAGSNRATCMEEVTTAADTGHKKVSTCK